MSDDAVALPPLVAEYEAFCVEGDYNAPSLFNGDTVYTLTPGAPDKALGKLSVVRLADGSRHICTLRAGPSLGRYTLLPINATRSPDAEVLEAAPVVWIKRGDGWASSCGGRRWARLVHWLMLW